MAAWHSFQDQAQQDKLDAATIYSMLENEIIPLYFAKNSKGYSPEWIQTIKNSIALIAPNYTTKRMLDDYIDILSKFGAVYVPKLTADYYENLSDEIRLENARVIIEKKWDIINSSTDSEKSFLEIFDDVFANCIDKHNAAFFYPLKKTDVLCRVVNGWGHNTDRFIPWPNKAQNRWNPPGRTYLYLSFSETPQIYSNELSLNEYICLEEYRAKRGEKYSFCLFEPLVQGNILDLYHFRQP